MTPVLYTTNLSKAQGIIPETLELLDLWEPGMSGAELKNRVRAIGVRAGRDWAAFQRHPVHAAGCA